MNFQVFAHGEGAEAMTRVIGLSAIIYCCDKWKYQGENRRELELRGRNYRHDIRENFVINQVKIGETGASVPRGVQA